MFLISAWIDTVGIGLPLIQEVSYNNRQILVWELCASIYWSLTPESHAEQYIQLSC